MAVVKRFKSLRPNNGFEEQVVSHPYDVMNRKEAKEMAGSNKNSFLRITRAEVDFDDSVSAYSDEVYAQGKKNLEDFIERGVLKEEKPGMYIYRLIMDGRAQVGLVACVSIDDYMNNVIKKHEFTRVEKEQDRINHFDSINGNTESIFLTYPAKDSIDKIIASYMETHEMIFDLEACGDVRHQLWFIDDEAVMSELEELFSKIPSLYIADGHHRSASAYKVGLKRREENKNHKGDETYNFFLATIFADNQLKILDYNRVVKDLNGYTKEEFIAEIEKRGFLVKDNSKEAIRPSEAHFFSMYLDNEWYLLEYDSKLVEDDIIKSLDVSILQDNLLAPVLGIGDPRKDKRIDFVGGIRGLKELERRVSTDMKVAFCLHPITIDKLIQISDNDLVMPPKSTWFEPKLASGLFLHLY